MTKTKNKILTMGVLLLFVSMVFMPVSAGFQINNLENEISENNEKEYFGFIWFIGCLTDCTTSTDGEFEIIVGKVGFMIGVYFCPRQSPLPAPISAEKGSKFSVYKDKNNGFVTLEILENRCLFRYRYVGQIIVDGSNNPFFCYKKNIIDFKSTLSAL